MIAAVAAVCAAKYLLASSARGRAAMRLAGNEQRVLRGRQDTWAVLLYALARHAAPRYDQLGHSIQNCSLNTSLPTWQ